jgi:hypothetical protein
MRNPDSHSDAVTHLGIEVRKVVTGRSNPVRGVLTYLENHPVDLIVLATRAEQSLAGNRR